MAPPDSKSCKTGVGALNTARAGFDKISRGAVPEEGRLRLFALATCQCTTMRRPPSVPESGGPLSELADQRTRPEPVRRSRPQGLPGLKPSRFH